MAEETTPKNKKPHNKPIKATTIEEAERRETPLAHKAFMIYLSMPPDGPPDKKRTLKNLCKLLGHPESYERALENWSRLLMWQERIKKLEDKELAELVAQKKLKFQQMLDDMNLEQAEEARKLRQKASGLLTDFDNMYARDAVALYKEATAVERLALGAATFRIEQETSFNPEKPLQIVADFGTNTDKNEEGQE